MTEWMFVENLAAAIYRMHRTDEDHAWADVPDRLKEVMRADVRQHVLPEVELFYASSIC